MYRWRAVQLKVTSDVKQLIPECFEKLYIQSSKIKKKKKGITKKSSTYSKTVIQKIRYNENIP